MAFCPVACILGCFKVVSERGRQGWAARRSQGVPVLVPVAHRGSAHTGRLIPGHLRPTGQAWTCRSHLRTPSVAVGTAEAAPGWVRREPGEGPSLGKRGAAEWGRGGSCRPLGTPRREPWLTAGPLSGPTAARFNSPVLTAEL